MRSDVGSSLLQTSSRNQCEFCEELFNDPQSRFRQLYGPKLESRIALRQDGFCVLPTLGQLFRGSLLVMPEVHFETMASLGTSMVKQLPGLLDLLEQKVSRFGLPLIFEHGAKAKTRSGCGIYHAHMHLVPVPSRFQFGLLIPDGAELVSSGIAEALEQVRFSDSYLLVRDTDGRVAFAEENIAEGRVFPSQHVRRRLVDHFKLSASWDWREYGNTEPWVFDTLDAFSHVSLGV